MKSFDSFLDEQKLEADINFAADLIVETKFPIFEFAEWYLDEGIYLEQEEIKVVLEGVWGDVAKGAGTGAAAAGAWGGPVAAAVGAGVGGLAGGLWSGAKNLWNKYNQKYNPADTLAAGKQEAIKVLTRLSQITQNLPDSHPDKEFSKTLNDMIGMLQQNTRVTKEPEPAKEPQQPAPAQPQDVVNTGVPSTNWHKPW